MRREAAPINQGIGRNRLASFLLGFAGTRSYLVGRYRVSGALSERKIR